MAVVRDIAILLGPDIETAVYTATMSGGTVATVGLKGLFLAVSR